MNEAVWSAIGAGTLFGLSGGFSPGPLLVLVISETLRHGLRVGIMVAITPLLTDFPVMLVAILLLNQLTHFDLLLGGISLAGAVFLLRIGWLSLKTAPIIPGEGEVRPHSIGTRMMTNYLNPSMYLFWFTVGAPFLVRSSCTDFWPGIVFILSFYISIIGANRSGIFVSLIPLFGTGMAIFFFNEEFKFYHLIASILIIIGLFLSNKKVRNA